jgi:hypothetical protein
MSTVHVSRTFLRGLETDSVVLASAEGEPGEEADGVERGLLHDFAQGLLGLGFVVGLTRGGLVLLPFLVDERGHATSQAFVGRLPLNVKGLADTAGIHAVTAAAPPELLSENLVLEVVILGELEAEGKAARVAVGELEALNEEGSEGGQEQLRVRGLDVLVDIWRSLLENESTEVGDLSNKLLTLLVEILAQLVLMANYAKRYLVSDQAA